MPQPDAPSATPLQSLLRALPAAVVALDADGAVAAWNSAAEAWFGVAEADALGRAPADAGIPEPARWQPLVSAARARGDGGCTGPIAMGARWVDLAVSPLPAGAGGGVLLLGSDVTAQVVARMEAEAVRELTVATASTLEPDRILAAVCEHARALLSADYARVDLPLLEGRAGASGGEEAWAALRDAHPGLLRRVRETGEALVIGVGGFSDDGVGAHQVLAAPPGAGAAMVLPLVADGVVAGALALGWGDAAALTPAALRLAGAIATQAAVAFHHAALFTALKESAIRRERFFSAMSHDLRTPITAIVGYSELLGDGIVGELDEKQREMVERISQVAGHLSQLVNDILDLAKLDAGRMEFVREEVPLAALVEDAVVTIRPQAAAKSLALSLELDEHGGAAVFVDPSRVRQILVNLLSNAVKFTEAGQITVSAGIGGDRGWIAVRDTGPGLPGDSEEVVFEEFLQIASGNKAKREPGSGLGLAISRRLARGMGGDLTAASAPGGGAVFTLVLPVSPEH
jgi:PAS domain S-box-containing protein